MLDADGKLITSGPLDYEEKSSYSIEVSAQTDRGEHASHVFTVEVLDVYEAPFDFNASELKIGEDASSGSVVGYMVQTSGDENVTVHYSLNYDPSSPPVPFMLDAEGKLFTSGRLDYEEESFYSIEVSAWTDRDESAVHVFTVEVLDVYEDRFDFNATELRIAENESAGSVVGQMYQVSGDENQTVEYTLLSSSGSQPTPFHLETNGTLILSDLLDFELFSQYSISVEGRTDSGEVKVRDFSILVSKVYQYEAGPLDFNSTQLRVSENVPSGTVVGQFYQISGDDNASIDYQITYDTSGDPLLFFLDGNGTLITLQSLDYEQNATHIVEVEASINDSTTVVRSFVIEVVDEYEEPFDFNATLLSVIEDAPIGTEVGSFYQTMGELTDSVIYNLIGGSTFTPPPFRLEANASLSLIRQLDYEKNASYEIEVSAWTDGNENKIRSFVIEVVDVYEEPFDFNTTVLTVTEDAPIGTEVGFFYQSMGEQFGPVTYNLIGGSAFSPPPFRLDTNGSLSLIRELDYEKNASYEIEVSAWADGNENKVRSFIVEVTDVYEEPFDFNATLLSVTEDTPIGTEVGFFYQSMGEQFGPVTYNLIGGSAFSPPPFRLDTNGSLSLIRELDYEKNASYEIEVSAWADGNENKIRSFVIEVLDVYEAPFDFNATALSVLENEPIGTLVGSVFQSSGKLDGPVSYLFDYPATQNPPPFMIESNGSVITNELLDFESQSSYAVTISANTDSGEMATHEYVIEVLDVYEAPFDFNATVFRVSEDATIGTAVGSVFQTSGKMDVSVVYGLEYPQTQNPPPFILEGNGTLVSTGMLDFETMPSYVISIRGITSGGETAIYDFTVEVLDVDELPPNNPPSDIEIEPVPLSVKGNKDVGTEVGTLMAVDLDPLDSHSFAIINGSGDRDNSYFKLSQNGLLTTREVLDLGSDQTLIIRVEVTDSRGDSFSKAIMIDYIHEEPGEDAVLLTDGVEVMPGWKRAGWFGFYFADFYPWVFHENLGWLFVSEKSMEGAWFHRERLGWVWTSPEVFPNLYMIEKNEWVYLDNNYPFTVLFDYQRMEWFLPDVDLYVAGSSNPGKGGYIKGLGNYQRGELATIEAVPESGYLFVEWRGSWSGTDPVQRFEMYEDFEVEAIFEPIISPNASPAENISNAVKAIEALDHLSTEEKQQSLVELLLFGKSSTAEISGSN